MQVVLTTDKRLERNLTWAGDGQGFSLCKDGVNAQEAPGQDILMLGLAGIQSPGVAAYSLPFDPVKTSIYFG